MLRAGRAGGQQAAWRPFTQQICSGVLRVRLQDSGPQLMGAFRLFAFHGGSP